MSDKPYGGKGKRTYNNGVIAKRYFEGEQPDGFVLGMLPRTNEQKAESNAKRIKTTLEKYGVSNEELILSRGYLPVYDCGQSTYIWRSDKNVE